MLAGSRKTSVPGCLCEGGLAVGPLDDILESIVLG